MVATTRLRHPNGMMRDADARYGNAYLRVDAPDHRFAAGGHAGRGRDAPAVGGAGAGRAPMPNLATFVTTWMEPEAQRVIA
jgi:glutamate decarboxylase